MPRFDLIVCNSNQTRTVYIQVKTKSACAWQTSTVMEQPARPLEPSVETGFWIMVDLGRETGTPRYWAVPDAWILNDTHVAHRS
jgi:hypothetical protein